MALEVHAEDLWSEVIDETFPEVAVVHFANALAPSDCRTVEVVAVPAATCIQVAVALETAAVLQGAAVLHRTGAVETVAGQIGYLAESYHLAAEDLILDLSVVYCLNQTVETWKRYDSNLVLYALHVFPATVLQ